MKHSGAGALLALAALTATMLVLLFVPAGTPCQKQAWIYLSIFIGASALTTSGS
jgi:hypothetical protein